MTGPDRPVGRTPAGDADLAGRTPAGGSDDDEDMRADEQLLAGHAVPGHDALAAALGELRALADRPAPAPTPALAAVLRDGLPAVALDAAPAPEASPVPGWALRAARWGAGLGVAGKILLGAGVAAAAVAGTATVPLVPDAIQVPVRNALTDLGHLIPGPAGGSLPAPSPSTPRPVGGVGGTPADDDPPAGPATPPAASPTPPRATPGAGKAGDPSAPARPGPAATGKPSGAGAGPRPTERPAPPVDAPGKPAGTPQGGPSAAATPAPPHPTPSGRGNRG